MTTRIKLRRNRDLARLAQIGPDERMMFWRYCQQTEGAAIARSRAKGVGYNIDAHYIDRLFVDQNWRCAVSGILFKAPRGADRGKHRKDPFGPSLDRIVPALGYTEGNLRVVCNIVNSAMNEWGLESLQALVRAMGAPAPRGQGTGHPETPRLVMQIACEALERKEG